VKTINGKEILNEDYKNAKKMKILKMATVIIITSHD